MKVKQILVLTVLVTLDFSLANSKKDSRFQNQQKTDETMALEERTAPKRKIFDFLALEDASQPRNLRPANSKNKRIRLVTFHLLNLNHTTRAPKLIGRRRNVTYIRPPSSFSYYRRGHSLKLNESSGGLKKSLTNSSQIHNLNRDTHANVSNVTKKIKNDKTQQPTSDHILETYLPFNETSFDDNSQLESKQVIEVTVVESNSTVSPPQTQDELQITLPTEKSSQVGQVSFFLKTPNTSIPTFLNVTSQENPSIKSPFNSTYVSVNYFPIVNFTESEVNGSIINNETAPETPSSSTQGDSDSLSINTTNIITSVAPSPSPAPSVVDGSISFPVEKPKELEEIPSHFQAAPISPARVASLLGIQQDSRSSVSDLYRNSGGFLGLGDFGNFGDLSGKGKSSSDFGLSNFGLNFDLLGSQLGSQHGSQHGSQLGSQDGSQHGSQHGSQLGHQLGSQFRSQFGSQTGTQLNGANQQNPFLGGFALDYLRQIADPNESKSSQLDLAQALSSLEAFKPPTAANDQLAIGSLSQHSGSSSSFPDLNFNDFLGLGSLNFLQGQQAPLNQLNSESLLSSLSFSPQLPTKNPTEAFPSPPNETPLPSTVDQLSESASKKTESKDVV